MKHFYLLFLGLLLFSCSENNTVETEPFTTTQDTTTAIAPKNAFNKKDLVEINNSMYVEYYPGKKQIKFKGPQDENGKRHGKWTHFSEEGVELSISEYEHGIPHGLRFVKYPNGNIHYVGQFEHGEKVGVWSTYTINGEVTKTDYSKK